MAEECESNILGAPAARVVQTKEMNLQNPLLICCFPSAGVVGTIAANALIEQFQMKEIAHVRSRYLPSAAIFLDGRLRHPFRIYGHQEKNILLTTTELPVAEEGMYFISSALLDWAAKVGVNEIVVLDGIPVQGFPSERKVLYAAEEEKIADLENNPNVEMLQKGIITGIAGSILSESLCRKKVGFALLTPAIAVVPDPEGAVQLLKVLNEMYSLDIDTSELEKSGEEIRKKMEEMAKQVDGMRRTQPGVSEKGFERMYG